MKRIGIFYGSTTGTTEAIAGRIAVALGVANSDVYDASEIKESLINNYDVLILGSSTWGSGELQDDWYDGLKHLAGMNLSDKTVALFGCGDSEMYPDTFCDAIGELYESLRATGCRFCGSFPIDGYTFERSAAEVDGRFVGLPLDEVNQEDMTAGRIERWVEILRQECLE